MKLTAEDSFLLRCVRAAVSGQCIECNDIARIDWARVRAVAERHQVAPLVYEAVQGAGCEDRLPEDVRSALLLEYHRTGMRNACIRERVAEILGKAAGNGIEVMLLKGAVLAYDHYPQCEHRALGDIDLLIRERDFRGFREVLDGFGYRSSCPRIRDPELPRYAHCFQQIRFHSSRVPPLEVHFRLLNLGMPGSCEPAWQDAQRLEFGGIEVWCPSPERFLLHLCLHAQQHSFAILRLLVDIAVWQRSGPVDPARFVSLARRHHLSTAAFYALAYATDLLGVPDTGVILERLRPPEWKRRVFERLWQDGRVRLLEAQLGPMEGELPRAFLLGEAPLADKALFLWNVALPHGEWLAASNGHRRVSRWSHMRRVFKGAYHALRGHENAAREASTRQR